ncbi:hypothetical protein E2C01_033123 [Portunus trituberculatus]|uniref:Uncharacterized protein n=1 Tax=Portunus trituberculatus TaxID=210409 RepID=A0A5B7F3C8_PORTR|nr:hypothetical protein [Portunus trituberculatus]
MQAVRGVSEAFVRQRTVVASKGFTQSQQGLKKGLTGIPVGQVRAAGKAGEDRVVAAHFCASHSLSDKEIQPLRSLRTHLNT